MNRQKRKIAFMISALLFCETIMPQQIMAEPIADEAVLQQNDTQQNDIQQNDTQQNITQKENMVTSDLNGAVMGMYLPEVMRADWVDTSEEGIVGAEASASKYDPRTENGPITAVKNQNPYGTCWAFGAINGAEASYNKNNGYAGSAAKNSVDFSERQLVYFANNNDGTTADPLGNTEGDSNVFCDSNGVMALEKQMGYGGNAEIAMLSMMSGMGPVDEAKVPYQKSSPTSVEEQYKYATDYWLKNARVIDMKQHDLVKQMIIDYGAVETSYYDNDGYRNKTYASYHYPVSAINHAVSIVGWDDDFSKDKFNVTPSENGAWLVKNSWGETNNGHEKGYFWLSYETTDVSDMSSYLYGFSGRNGYAFDVDSRETKSNYYEYDGSVYPGLKFCQNGTSVANVYTAAGYGTDETEVLDSVMAGFGSANLEYSVQIYKNPGKNPTSGTAMLSKPVTGTTDAMGFYNIKLPEKIVVEKSDRFAVVITVNSLNDSSFWMMVAATADMNYTNAEDKVVATLKCINKTEENQSFMKSAYSSSWTDMNDSGSCTFRIKVMSRANEDVPVKSISFNTAKLTLQLKEKAKLQYTVSPNNAAVGKIIYKSSDPTVAIVDSDGTVTAEGYGTTQISVTTSNGKSAVCEVSVTRKRALVSFDSKGGESIDAISYMQEVAYEEVSPLPKLTRVGYDFLGWYTSANYKASEKVTDKSIVLKKDSYTLYAKWEPKKITVSFVSNGGNAVADRTYQFGEKLGSLPSNYRANYNFLGWYVKPEIKEENKITTDYVIESENDITLYAGWAEIEPTAIRFLQDTVVLNRGEEQVIMMQTEPAGMLENCQNLSYASDNIGIVEIDEGIIHAVAPGTATVTASAYTKSGTELTAACSVTVKGYAGLEAFSKQKTALIGETVSKNLITVKAYYDSSDKEAVVLDKDEYSISPEVIEKQGTNKIVIHYPAENLTTEVYITGVSEAEYQNRDISPIQYETTAEFNPLRRVQTGIHIAPVLGTSMEIDSKLYIKVKDHYEQAENIEIIKSETLEAKDPETGEAETENAESDEFGYNLVSNENLKDGKYKWNIHATVDGKEYYLPLNVKVKRSKPSIKVKASQINVFYKNAGSDLTFLAPGVQIKNIILNDELAKWYRVNYDPNTGTGKLTLLNEAGKSTSGIVKKGTISVETEEYKTPVTLKLSIPVIKTAPSLKLSETNVTINHYFNQYDKTLQILTKDGTASSVERIFADNETETYLREYSYDRNNGKIYFKLDSLKEAAFQKGKILSFYASDSNWESNVKLTVKVTLKKQPPVCSLANSTLKINKSYVGSCEDTLLISNLPDGCIELSAVDISSASNTDYAPVISVEKEETDGKYHVRAFAKKSLKTGNYQYMITPKIQTEEGEKNLKTVKLKVTVTENKGEASVDLKPASKSKLSLADGANAKVFYQANMKNISGTILSATGSGKTPFTVSLTDSQQICIGLAQGEMVKAIKYIVPVRLVILDPANQQHVVNTSVTIKPQDTKVKMAYTTTGSMALSLRGYGECNTCTVKGELIAQDAQKFTEITCFVPAGLENAFSVRSNTAAGTMKIGIADPAKLKANQSYNLTVKYKVGYSNIVYSKKVAIKIIP